MPFLNLCSCTGLCKQSLRGTGNKELFVDTDSAALLERAPSACLHGEYTVAMLINMMGNFKKCRSKDVPRVL